MSTDHKEYGERVIRLITFNLEVDGGEDENGNPPERWRAAHELLASRRPDALFRQEATFSHLQDNRRLRAAGRILGMQGFLSPNGSGSNPTALFVRPETFQAPRQYQHLRHWRTPPTRVDARLDGAPERIVMMSWHFAFNSPRGRERETEEILAQVDKVKQGTSFIGAGDCNEYPWPEGETEQPIDWTSPDITDLVHVRHRTNKAPDGSRVSCTYLDETLLSCGLHDPARYAARRGQTSALKATAGRTAKGQGGPCRIDRFYLDPWLVNAVLEVNVVDMRGISDHDAVEVICSYRGCIEALQRQSEPLPRMRLAV
ncbi:endonuclease/exonuclease/phosphatase family protein [Streptomyces sp. FXJ1.4098]|nr:endonuclease/exonuclease/phosphatase family protein [Streptomyces sp. FXJ1.4098]